MRAKPKSGIKPMFTKEAQSIAAIRNQIPTVRSMNSETRFTPARIALTYTPSNPDLLNPNKQGTFFSELNVRAERVFSTVQESDVHAYAKRSEGLRDDLDYIDTTVQGIDFPYNGRYALEISGLFRVQSKRWALMGRVIAGMLTRYKANRQGLDTVTGRDLSMPYAYLDIKHVYEENFKGMNVGPVRNYIETFYTEE